MPCEYISGIRNIKCPLYNSKELRGITALTKEFKKEICDCLDHSWLPILEEHTSKDPEKCPIYVSLLKETFNSYKEY